jgi:hypothetical protein
MLLERRSGNYKRGGMILFQGLIFHPWENKLTESESRYISAY